MKTLLPALLVILLGVSPLGADPVPGGSGDASAATAIEISGDVVYEADGGIMKPVELGQLFVEGDRLLTKEESDLHLILADGSSIVMGASSEMTLGAQVSTSKESKNFFDLLQGSLDAIVEKLKANSTFEIHTAYAIAAVKGAQFEIANDDGESSVTVQEGIVTLSDPLQKKTEDVLPFQRALASQGRLNRAFQLPKRESGEFEARWARARMIHGQRAELMKHFNQHLHQRRAALQARRAGLRKRLLQHSNSQHLQNR